MSKLNVTAAISQAINSLSHNRRYFEIVPPSIDHHNIVLILYGRDICGFDWHFGGGDCRGDWNATLCFIRFDCFLLRLLLFLHLFKRFFDSITNTGLTSLQKLRHLSLWFQFLLAQPFIDCLKRTCSHDDRSVRNLPSPLLLVSSLVWVCRRELSIRQAWSDVADSLVLLHCSNLGSVRNSDVLPVYWQIHSSSVATSFVRRTTGFRRISIVLLWWTDGRDWIHVNNWDERA